ncbi:MAG: MFS transporter [Promethearchaeota archaeon]|nr:MAG: MFS transporter [Candidatus Lokiarchaeota archaeon]
MAELADQHTFRSYLFFWTGQLFSLLGSLVIFFVIFVWITIVTGSETMLALGNFIYMIPMLILTPFAGVISDRYNRKYIILIVDSLQAYFTLLLTIFFIFNAAHVWIVLIFIAIRSVFQSFHSPVVSAIMPSMVPKDKLGRINGINYFFTGLIQLIGPVVGATFLFFFPIQIVLWVDVITFLISLIPLLLVKIPRVNNKLDSNEKSSFFIEMKEGFTVLRTIPGLLKIMGAAMLLNMLIQPLIVLMPIFILEFHRGDIFILAILEMILQGGMIIGAVIPSIKKKWKNSIRTMFIGILVLNIGYLMYAIAPIGYYPIIGSGAFVLGFILPIVNTILLTVVQKTVPQDKMGRVFSILNTLSMIASPIGAIVSGPLSEIFGISWVYFYCAILGIVISLSIYMFTNLRHIDYDKEINGNIENKIE